MSGEDDLPPDVDAALVAYRRAIIAMERSGRGREPVAEMEARADDAEAALCLAIVGALRERDQHAEKVAQKLRERVLAAIGVKP